MKRLARAARVLTVLGAALLPLVLPPSASSAPGEGRAAVLKEVEEALARWDVAAARELLESLSDDGATPAPYHEGRLALLAGDYAGALEWFGKVRRGAHAGAELARMVSLAQGSLELSRRLSLRESEHFSLFLDGARDGILADPAVAALEAAYRSVGGWLGLEPGEKVRVEIVPDVQSFEQVSGYGRGSVERAGAVGLCRFNRITILSPRVLVRGYRWRDSLVHQYVHYLLVRLSYGRAPAWLQEGVARYADTLWRSPQSLWLGRMEESLLAEASERGTLMPLAELQRPLVDLPSMARVRLAFAQSALGVAFILDGWGMGELKTLLEKSSAEAAEPGAVMREVLGVDPAGFEEGLRRHVRRRGFRAEEGVTAPDLRLQAGAHAEAGEEDLERLQPREARRHLKLGDMLRERGHLDAALKEYEKALERAPLSPYVRNRTGRILLELSDRSGAEEMFRKGTAIAPDYPGSYANLAEVLALEGRWEDSRRALEEYLEINPFNPVIWKDLGSVHMELGETETAVKYWETSLRLNPADPELRRILGRP